MTTVSPENLHSHLLPERIGDNFNSDIIPDTRKVILIVERVKAVIGSTVPWEFQVLSLNESMTSAIRQVFSASFHDTNSLNEGKK